jgi:hypothetical protein
MDAVSAAIFDRVAVELNKFLCFLIDLYKTLPKAVISLENTQIHRYALEPAGTLIFRCWSLFSDGV